MTILFCSVVILAVILNFVLWLFLLLVWGIRGVWTVMKSTKGHNSSRDMDWTPNSALTSAGMIGSNPIVYRQKKLEVTLETKVGSQICFNIQVLVLVYCRLCWRQVFYTHFTKKKKTQHLIPVHKDIFTSTPQKHLNFKTEFYSPCF